MQSNFQLFNGVRVINTPNLTLHLILEKYETDEGMVYEVAETFAFEGEIITDVAFKKKYSFATEMSIKLNGHDGKLDEEEFVMINADHVKVKNGVAEVSDFYVLPNIEEDYE